MLLLPFQPFLISTPADVTNYSAGEFAIGPLANLTMRFIAFGLTVSILLLISKYLEMEPLAYNWSRKKID